ncbi:hypothetical protein PPACK8108_LOCUS7376 [Phakopsora pachyrhizi]|uniref:Uncharacterized protein n=1 Tax=Phakopsora pachyrhizi TaxID=170000 RepID=A0AAV0AU31_PHAPC|nr:hypothetical protein PPACK8108_LOCUS7376 [Phakopsora pachyrhizi]
MRFPSLNSDPPSNLVHLIDKNFASELHMIGQQSLEPKQTAHDQAVLSKQMEQMVLLIILKLQPSWWLENPTINQTKLHSCTTSNFCNQQVSILVLRPFYAPPGSLSCQMK